MQPKYWQLVVISTQVVKQLPSEVMVGTKASATTVGWNSRFTEPPATAWQ